MRSVLFSIFFLISVCLVFKSVCTEDNGLGYICEISGCECPYAVGDTIKVVNDTSFCMSMGTNDPFNGRDSLVINLMTIPDSSYSFPLLNARVLSEFGMRGGRKHTGVDLKTYADDTIRAVFDGRIIKSLAHDSYGNCILIRHTNGLETLYSHNSKNLVQAGDSVKAGQAISLAGRTGRATTEHLHFECRIRNTRFNPNLLFDYSTEKLRYGYLLFINLGNSVGVEIREKKKERCL